MNTRVIRWIVLGIAGVVAIVLFVAANAGTPSASSSSDGRVVADHATYDFGQLSMANGTVTHRFELKNPSGTPVVLTKIVTSCMCTTAEVKDSGGAMLGRFGMPGHGGGSAAANITVAPGAAVALDAVFDPAAHGPSGVGRANRSIMIETNSSATPRLELGFQALVAP